MKLKSDTQGIANGYAENYNQLHGDYWAMLIRFRLSAQPFRETQTRVFMRKDKGFLSFVET